MITRPRYELGYYGHMQHMPFHNPIQGGIAWWSDGGACLYSTNDPAG